MKQTSSAYAARCRFSMSLLTLFFNEVHAFVEFQAFFLIPNQKQWNHLAWLGQILTIIVPFIALPVNVSREHLSDKQFVV